MKRMFVPFTGTIFGLGFLLLVLAGCSEKNNGPIELSSKDGLNTITLSLDDKGSLSYMVTKNGRPIIERSPLGLIANDQDFTQGLTISEVSELGEKRENYRLQVGNSKEIDQVFKSRSVTVKNGAGALLAIDLIAGKEGVAFRYRFPETPPDHRTIEEELTGFHIGENAKGWLQPYNKAGDYTPGYEDFYFKVRPGDSIANPRNPSVGWCMPALFNVNGTKNWVLIAESGTDGTFPGCHLRPDSDGGIYKVAFAKTDEKYTLPLDDKETALPRSALPWTMPWRVIIIGDKAGDILLSTLITDLAPESKIEDASWIGTGKASWSWWSHPDDHSPEVYNEFTDLATSLNWEYTLFDAGWEEANKKGQIIDYAISKGIKPMVWGYSASYFNPEERKKRFKELAEMGITGVKIDFWCSDRQEVMGALHSVFEDAAKEHLMINLHGTTVPRGWHRTWPNFMTAEAVLGTESYFYEPRFPEKAAEQNTVLPFTRNVAGPTDYTPVALTMRKFPRLTSAVHELATPMIYTSGIIHFADSKEVFDSLPQEVKELLKEMPATWDASECIIGAPGEAIVMARQKEALSYLVGINGTDDTMPVKIDLAKYGDNFTHYRLITEGEDPLMDFKIETFFIDQEWSYTMAPRGGFIIQFIKEGTVQEK